MNKAKLHARMALAAMFIAGGVLLAGCGTTKSQQMMDTVTSTHDLTRKINADLGPRIAKLNENIVDLNARVAATEHDGQSLNGLVQESMRKLDEANSKLDALSRALYQETGASFSPGAETGVTGTPTDETLLPEPGDGPMTPLPDVNPDGLTSPDDGVMRNTAQGPAVNPMDVYYKAQKAYMRNDFAGALPLYDDYLKRYPDSNWASKAQYWKARCYLDMAKADNDPELYEKAIVEYERLRKTYPKSDKDASSMLDQALAHKQLRQVEDARRLLEKIIKDNPATSADTVSAKTELDKLGKAGR